MFRGLHRPGQGFKHFAIFRKEGGVTETGRPCAEMYRECGSFLGIISEASPQEIEQAKQAGHPITHTIVQRGTKDRARALDVLKLIIPPADSCPSKPRCFIVQVEPKDPGELGHFLIYRVQERQDML